MAPSPKLFPRLVGPAFAIAVVGFAIAISLGKIFALRHGYRVDSNQVRGGRGGGRKGADGLTPGPGGGGARGGPVVGLRVEGGTRGRRPVLGALEWGRRAGGG